MTTTPPSTDRLYGKYHVTRADGGERPDADYFVLNLCSDYAAQIAALAYARICQTTQPGLAADLRARVAAHWDVPVEAVEAYEIERDNPDGDRVGLVMTE